MGCGISQLSDKKGSGIRSKNASNSGLVITKDKSNEQAKTETVIEKCNANPLADVM